MCPTCQMMNGQHDRYCMVAVVKPAAPLERLDRGAAPILATSHVAGQRTL